MKSNIKLRTTLKVLRSRHSSVGSACVPRRLDVVNQIDERIHRQVAKVMCPQLNCLHSGLQFILRPLVTGLARAIDIEQWRTYVMIADL